MMRRIVLIEDARQAWEVMPDRADLLVTLEPEAQYALERRGVEHHPADEFYSADALVRQGIDNFSRAERLCRHIDNRLQASCPRIGRARLRPAWYQFLALKTLLDAVHLRWFVLTSIVDAIQPAEVAYFAPPLDSPIDDMLRYQAESIYAHLVPLLGWKGVRHALLPGPRGPRSHARTGPTRWTQRWATRAAAVHGQLGGWKGYLRAWTGRMGEVLMLDTATADIRLLARELVWRSRLAVLFWSPAHAMALRLTPPSVLRIPDQSREVCIAAEELHATWPSLRDDETVQRLFSREGAMLFHAAETRLRHACTVLAAQAVGTFLRASQLMRSRQIKAVVASQIVGHRLNAVAEAAKHAGVPVATYQHGELGTRNAPIIGYTELDAADYILTFGEGVSDFCRRRYPRGPVPIAVGSASLDVLARHRGNRMRERRRLGIEVGKTVLVYAPSGVYGKGLYVTYSYPASNQRYFEIQRTIVESVRGLDHVHLLVKPHPATSSGFPLADYVSDRGPGNCTVLPAGLSLSRLHTVADAFIVDLPTMTLLEMLTTGKPVFVFNDFFQWEREAFTLLERAVVFRDRLDEFADAIRAHVRRSMDGVGGTDNDFLRLFGTHLGDGNSASRAAAAVESLCRLGPDGFTANRAALEFVSHRERR